jgi:hypothetical protein
MRMNHFEGAQITVVEADRLPTVPTLLGYVDFPKPGPVEDELVVIGWALTPDGPVESVDVVVGAQAIGSAPAGRARPDLERAFPDIPRAAEGGFRVTIPADSLAGVETLTVEVVARGGVRTPIWTIVLGSTLSAYDVTSESGESERTRSERPRRRLFRRRR